MKQIRDAVGWAKTEVELLYGYDDVLNKNTKEMLNILIYLAEKVLAVGIGLSVDEIISTIANIRPFVVDKPEIANAIHSAQMEKLGGVR